MLILHYVGKIGWLFIIGLVYYSRRPMSQNFSCFICYLVKQGGLCTWTDISFGYVLAAPKVNLLESESGSLYALCRSWVRNGVPHESQVSPLFFFQMNAVVGCLLKLLWDRVVLLICNFFKSVQSNLSEVHFLWSYITMLLWFQRNVYLFSLTNVACIYLLVNTMIFFVSKCFRRWC